MSRASSASASGSARDHAEVALARCCRCSPDGAEERALGDAVEYATLRAAPGELPRRDQIAALVGDALLERRSREPVPDGLGAALARVPAAR